MTTSKQELHTSRFFEWKFALAITFGALCIYYLLGFSFTSQSFDFTGVTFWDMIYMLLIDQLLIEYTFVSMLLYLMDRYTHLLKITDHVYQASTLIRIITKYIPLFFGAFFLINPVTQTLRYIFRNADQLDWSIYISEYLFNIPLYVTYTFFSFLIGVVAIIKKMSHVEEVGDAQNVSNNRIVGEHEAVLKPILHHDIWWIAVEERRYWAYTSDKKVRLNKKINELEGVLPRDVFIRINRSTIVNINYIESYSSWDNGSYLVEMNSPHSEEFIVSRGRVKQFKMIMNTEL